uniref:Uncharacterized protein n=1 Tax=Arundo donax TaxID=35708 RepID=A0A0A9C382_ARUDO
MNNTRRCIFLLHINNTRRIFLVKKIQHFMNCFNQMQISPFSEKVHKLISSISVISNHNA